jgi:hypothetical protein
MDTIRIIHDSISDTFVAIPDTLNIKAFYKSIDPSSHGFIKDLLGFIAGITAVSIGFVLNQFSSSIKERKQNLKDFEDNLLIFSKGQLSFIELLKCHNHLVKRERQKIDIMPLKEKKDPIERHLECEKILKQIKL